MSDFKAEWEKARIPEVDEVEGRFKIKIYPRILWCLFVDYKIIDKLKGINKAFGRFEWGPFTIEITLDGILLNYNGARWPFVLIRDYVRELSEGMYLGKFCLKIGKKEKRLFWFTMELVV